MADKEMKNINFGKIAKSYRETRRLGFNRASNYSEISPHETLLSNESYMIVLPILIHYNEMSFFIFCILAKYL